MKSAVTICLVPQARRGPFVFHDGLEDGCRKAAQLGFDAVEIFPPSAEAVDCQLLRSLLDQYKLQVAAIGTGAGWVINRLSLTDDDPSRRTQAVDFIKSIIDLAGQFAAPAIIGSMQGQIADASQRDSVLNELRRALTELAGHATQYQTQLLLEPLNRYESNVFNQVAETASWMRTLPCDNVRVLADLFHMNIEESDIAQAIRDAGDMIGHVHFADSNRHAIGSGHTPIEPIIDALRQCRYEGYLAAEIFPIPDSFQAAQQTIQSFNRCLRHA